ncbi:helix-turn-helix domain-containing protein [Neobacillus sp. GCM10023253]|uniref:helix-turn-helix domain-containing protein n=1 Tax=Neobacillus sp. GCM10023253 TaxID=3252644 RepID=UPI003619EED3
MGNYLNSRYGKVLKKLRKELDLTQAELAVRCSLEPSYISLLERELKKPGFDTLWALSKGLELMPSELLRKIEEHSEVGHGDGSCASKFASHHIGGKLYDEITD